MEANTEEALIRLSAIGHRVVYIMSVILVDWLPKLILTLWISVSSITPCLS